MKDSPLKTNLLLALLCLIWGSTWLAIKISLTGIPPFWGVSLRFLIAGAVLLGITRISGGRIPVSKLFRPDVIICGIIMYCGSYALVYWGEQYISSGLSSIIFAVMPFYAGIMAHLWIKGEKLTLIKLSGIIIGFAGVYIVFKDNIHVYGDYGLYGMLAMAIAPLFSAAGAVMIKARLTDFDTISLTGFQMLIGAICLLPVAALTEDIRAVHPNWASLAALLYLALFGSALTFVTYYRLIKSVGVTKTSLVAFITPLVAVVIGALVYHERINRGILLGGAMVATGVVLVTGLYGLWWSIRRS